MTSRSRTPPRRQRSRSRTPPRGQRSRSRTPPRGQRARSRSPPRRQRSRPPPQRNSRRRRSSSPPQRNVRRRRSSPQRNVRHRRSTSSPPRQRDYDRRGRSQSRDYDRRDRRRTAPPPRDRRDRRRPAPRVVDPECSHWNWRERYHKVNRDFRPAGETGNGMMIEWLPPGQTIMSNGGVFDWNSDGTFRNPDGIGAWTTGGGAGRHDHTEDKIFPKLNELPNYNQPGTLLVTSINSACDRCVSRGYYRCPPGVDCIYMQARPYGAQTNYQRVLPANGFKILQCAAHEEYYDLLSDGFDASISDRGDYYQYDYNRESSFLMDYTSSDYTVLMTLGVCVLCCLITLISFICGGIIGHWVVNVNQRKSEQNKVSQEQNSICRLWLVS
eukprot:411395_1